MILNRYVAAITFCESVNYTKDNIYIYICSFFVITLMTKFRFWIHSKFSVVSKVLEYNRALSSVLKEAKEHFITVYCQTIIWFVYTQT